jgi:hypothetical protein
MPEAQVLAITAIDGAEERVLAYSDTATLFPVSLTPDGALLYYVALDEVSGSRLMVTRLTDGTSDEVGILSPDLTRDWTVSPDGTQIAFLEVALSAAGATSRAYVYDVPSKELRAVTDESDAAAFGPVWSADGRLAVGVIRKTGEATLISVEAGSKSAVARPDEGLFVPLSFIPAGGGYVVRSFENASASAPGKSSLTLIDAAGERREIATGEVTFVGWTTP